MNFLQLLIIASALLAGYVIGRFTQEELSPGKKWFVLAKRTLFLAIAFVFLYSHKWQLLPMTAGLAFVFAYLTLKQARTWWLVQSVLGISYALVQTTSLAFLYGAIIFLYGLPTGALLAKKAKITAPLLAGLVFFAVSAVVTYLL
jgi:hypothetical protein